MCIPINRFAKGKTPYKMHQQKPPSKIGIIQKITNFILGFFVGFLVFFFCLKILSSMWGAILGLALNIFVCGYTFKIFKNDPPKKIVSIGLLVSIIVIIAIYLLISALVYSLFSNIAA